MGQKIGFMASQINKSKIVSIRVKGQGEIGNYVDSLATFVTVGAMSHSSETMDMILFKNSDVPGVIGSVGTILANNNVNISDFSLARNENKEALAVILVDNAVSDKTLEELAALFLMYTLIIFIYIKLHSSHIASITFFKACIMIDFNNFTVIIF